jgi:hypothetical protein
MQIEASESPVLISPGIILLSAGNWTMPTH